MSGCYAFFSNCLVAIFYTTSRSLFFPTILTPMKRLINTSMVANIVMKTKFTPIYFHVFILHILFLILNTNFETVYNANSRRLRNKLLNSRFLARSLRFYRPNNFYAFQSSYWNYARRMSLINIYTRYPLNAAPLAAAYFCYSLHASLSSFVSYGMTAYASVSFCKSVES